MAPRIALYELRMNAGAGKTIPYLNRRLPVLLKAGGVGGKQYSCS